MSEQLSFDFDHLQDVWDINKKHVESFLEIDAPHLQLDQLAELCHLANWGWWVDLQKREFDPDRNVGELYMLIVSELAESFEGLRRNVPDDKLPQYPNWQVEIVDLLIRIFDFAGAKEIPLADIFLEKMRYNMQRPDHTFQARLEKHGKKF